MAAAFAAALPAHIATQRTQLEQRSRTTCIGAPLLAAGSGSRRNAPRSPSAARVWSASRSAFFGAVSARSGSASASQPFRFRPQAPAVILASGEPTSDLKKQIEAVAMQAAREAGAIIRAKCGNPDAAVVKGVAVDLVTEVDKASEELVRGYIARNFPSHSILGEEGVEPGSEASAKALDDLKDAEWLWIIDPLDGTLNFVHGLPLSVVSIAVAYRGELQVGVIYDPYMNEMYAARKGEGSFLNGRPMRVSGPEEGTLTQAMLATGFPATVRPEICRGMTELIPLCRSLRASGSACLHLAWVASGRLTGFWECDLNSWDIAAGAILVMEAGGRMSDTLGCPYQLSDRNVIASNGLIHDDIAAALARCDGTGFKR
eukprot:tig00000488_g1343.t1